MTRESPCALQRANAIHRSAHISVRQKLPVALDDLQVRVPEPGPLLDGPGDNATPRPGGKRVSAWTIADSRSRVSRPSGSGTSASIGGMLAVSPFRANTNRTDIPRDRRSWYDGTSRSTESPGRSMCDRSHRTPAESPSCMSVSAAQIAAGTVPESSAERTPPGEGPACL
jgi:hypothetical protein